MIRIMTMTIGLGVMFACQQVASAQHTKDTLEEVKKALADKKAVLIDVREKREWDEGHLKDAKSVPLSEIKALEKLKAEELLKLVPKGSIVYLHCKAGGRCVTAADILKKQGIDARPLADGYEALVKAGFESAK